MPLTPTATTPSTVQGGTNGYTITIANPNASPVTLNAVTDDLPAGFTYVPGSTTGSTTNNPTAAGGTLTWAGPIQVPAGGAATVTFNVVVSPTLGVYTNQAAADAAGGFTVVPSGPTAPVEVIANPTPPTISIDDVAVVEGNAGTVIAQFTVSLSAVSGRSVGVNFATADGTAVAPVGAPAPGPGSRVRQEAACRPNPRDPPGTRNRCAGWDLDRIHAGRPYLPGGSGRPSKAAGGDP